MDVCDLPQESLSSPTKNSEQESTTTATIPKLSLIEQKRSIDEQKDKVIEKLIKYLFVDNIGSIRVDESQKTLMLEDEEAFKMLNLLEEHEISFRYCRLCEIRVD